MDLLFPGPHVPRVEEFQRVQHLQMMMIAFITFKSSLVPLFEGYDVQIHGNLSCRGLDGIEPTT